MTFAIPGSTFKTHHRLPAAGSDFVAYYEQERRLYRANGEKCDLVDMGMILPRQSPAFNLMPQILSRKLGLHLIGKALVQPQNLRLKPIKHFARRDAVTANFKKLRQNSIASNRGD